MEMAGDLGIIKNDPPAPKGSCSFSQGLKDDDYLEKEWLEQRALGRDPGVEDFAETYASSIDGARFSQRIYNKVIKWATRTGK